MSLFFKLDVDNILIDDGIKFSVDFNFKSIDDFEFVVVVN